MFEHLTEGHGIGRGRNVSVKGAHNINGFYKTIDAEAEKYGLSRSDFIIGEPKPHPKVTGVYEIRYRIPSLETDYVNGGLKLKLDANGNIMYKEVKNPKTVYGPPITDDDILKWGQEAVKNVEKAGIPMQEGINQGATSNGLLFEWRLKDGKIDSIYPILLEGK
ncbi:CdiA family toxin C-terminal domain-containing protein [Paenibacillus sp. ALJ109b]|uniref:CdiA family toxin C-terminal domain-containing protein n=1 Tax=Paenibacillus sp. ALJ109b TaxID=2709068 RepID=UPI0013D11909|nr:CdiA family toxin C-terminal domain-containing protein [Paenibacillus sp. ALJ109b]NEU60516.1 EndoU domain-containing protein [Paenibacillus sp. ALJ109b]